MNCPYKNTNNRLLTHPKMCSKRKLDNGSGSAEKKAKTDLTIESCIMYNYDGENKFFMIVGEKFGPKYPVVELIKKGNKYVLKEDEPKYIMIDGAYWPLSLRLDPKTKDKNRIDKIWYDTTQKDGNPGMIALLMKYNYRVEMGDFEEEIIDVESEEEEKEKEKEKKEAEKEKKDIPKSIIIPIGMERSAIKDFDVYEKKIPGILLEEAKKSGIKLRHIIYGCSGSYKCVDSESLLKKLTDDFFAIPEFKDIPQFSIDVDTTTMGWPFGYDPEIQPPFDIVYYNFGRINLQGRKKGVKGCEIKPLDQLRTAFENKIFNNSCILGIILGVANLGMRDVPIQQQLWMNLEKLAVDNGYKIQLIGTPETYGLQPPCFFSKFKITVI